MLHLSLGYGSGMSIKTSRHESAKTTFDLAQQNCARVRNIVVGSSLYGNVSEDRAIIGFCTSLAQEVAPFKIGVTVLEPGGVKTAMAHEFSTAESIEEPYRGTFSATFEAVRGNKDIWGGPTEIAAAVVRLSHAESPPLRLLLGRDTVGIGKFVSTTQAASDEECQHLNLFSEQRLDISGNQYAKVMVTM